MSGEMIFSIVMAGGAVLFGLFALIGLTFDSGRAARDRERRKTELAAVAAKIGADYRAADLSVLQGFKKVPFFPQAAENESYLQATSVMRAQNGGQTQAIYFDMLSTDSDFRFSMTVAMFRLGAARLPSFQLEKKNIDLGADGFSTMHGNPYGPDVVLSARPAFNQVFRLHGKDAVAIERLFDSNLCDFVEAHGEWSVESTGTWLVVGRKFYQPAVEKYPEFIAHAAQILAAFQA